MAEHAAPSELALPDTQRDRRQRDNLRLAGFGDARPARFKSPSSILIRCTADQPVALYMASKRRWITSSSSPVISPKMDKAPDESSTSKVTRMKGHPITHVSWCPSARVTCTASNSLAARPTLDRSTLRPLNHSSSAEDGAGGPAVRTARRTRTLPIWAPGARGALQRSGLPASRTYDSWPSTDRGVTAQRRALVAEA